MSPHHIGPNSPLKEETKANKYHFLTTVKQINAYIERGWDWEHCEFQDGFYSIEEFCAYLNQYQIERSHLGPLEIHLYQNVGDNDWGYSFYQKRPYGPEEIQELEDQRQAILSRQDQLDRDLVRRYLELMSRRPTWTRNELTDQLCGGNQ